jgi:hypothetical protein
MTSPAEANHSRNIDCPVDDPIAGSQIVERPENVESVFA